MLIFSFPLIFPLYFCYSLGLNYDILIDGEQSLGEDYISCSSHNVSFLKHCALLRLLLLVLPSSSTRIHRSPYPCILLLHFKLVSPIQWLLQWLQEHRANESTHKQMTPGHNQPGNRNRFSVRNQFPQPTHFNCILLRLKTNDHQSLPKNARKFTCAGTKCS